MTDSNVLRILQTRSKTAVASSIAPNLPIHFLGRTFDPPNDGKHVELIFLPNNQDRYYGNEMLFQGIFRLVLHWPANNEGAYEPLNVIASVASAFTKTTTLHGGGMSLQIYQKPKLGGLISKDNENLFPASMSYRSFQP